MRWLLRESPLLDAPESDGGPLPGGGEGPPPGAGSAAPFDPDVGAGAAPGGRQSRGKQIVASLQRGLLEEGPDPNARAAILLLIEQIAVCDNAVAEMLHMQQQLMVEEELGGPVQEIKLGSVGFLRIPAHSGYVWTRPPELRPSELGRALVEIESTRDIWLARQPVSVAEYGRYLVAVAAAGASPDLPNCPHARYAAVRRTEITWDRSADDLPVTGLSIKDIEQYQRWWASVAEGLAPWAPTHPYQHELAMGVAGPLARELPGAEAGPWGHEELVGSVWQWARREAPEPGQSEWVQFGGSADPGAPAEEQARLLAAARAERAGPPWRRTELAVEILRSWPDLSRDADGGSRDPTVGFRLCLALEEARPPVRRRRGRQPAAPEGRMKVPPPSEVPGGRSPELLRALDERLAPITPGPRPAALASSPAGAERQQGAPPAGPEIPATFEALRAAGLFDVLGGVFADEYVAASLIARLELRDRLPSFGSMLPVQFWLQVGQQIERGVIEDGLPRLLAEASMLFPGNATLRALCERCGPAAALRREPGEVDRAGSELLVRLPQELPMEQILRVAETLKDSAGAAGERPAVQLVTRGSTNFSMYFENLSAERQEEVMRFMEAELQRRGVGAVAIAQQPLRHPDYFLDPIRLVGPDNQPFEVSEIRSGTPVREVIRAAIYGFGDEGWPRRRDGTPRPAVLDLVQADGSCRRLDPTMSLAEAGVRPGDTLRFAPESTAG